MFFKVIFSEVTVMINFICLAMEKGKTVYLFALFLSKIAVVFANELIKHIDSCFTYIFDTLYKLVICFYKHLCTFLVGNFDTIVLQIL